MNFLKIKRSISGLLTPLFLLVFLCPVISLGEESEKTTNDNRYGLGLAFGNSYDPTGDIDFYMLSGSVLYDYEKIWHHSAPEALRFKVEYNIGAARENEMRFMTSLNIFALYYFDALGDDIKPYIEGGIGIIYTDFRVKGQGLKINFNPQMGAGVEFNTKSREAYFLSLRLHHISNGGLNHENRGINSAFIIFGRYF
jgi:lipid A 3-O-deacylase